MSFDFRGPIEASKSLFNRALVIGSFFPDLVIRGDSKSRDVELMKKAVAALGHETNLRLICGEAGTVIRFLAFRVARIPGRHELIGSERLLVRPMTEIEEGLSALGVKASLLKDRLAIEGDGWQQPSKPVEIARGRSSQFASALLLSSWQLPFDLELSMRGPEISEAYWQMSVSLCRHLGMEIVRNSETYRVPAGQALKVFDYQVEADASSSFAIASFAALDGRAEFTNLPEISLQPDHIFLRILEDMGVKRSGSTLVRGSSLRPVVVNLSEAPDLFPVLAVLCAFADGKSRLHGAPHLKHKESDRLEKTFELLSLAGVKTEKLADGLVIDGRGADFIPAAFQFDPDEDHRMAMAAALFAKRQDAIEILHPEVVNKSFPDFWRLIRAAERP